MEIGIQEMRDSASAFVRIAEGGTVVTITRHGKPVAQLGPVEIKIKGEAEQVPKMEAAGE